MIERPQPESLENVLVLRLGCPYEDKVAFRSLLIIPLDPNPRSHLKMMIIRKTAVKVVPQTLTQVKMPFRDE